MREEDADGGYTSLCFVLWVREVFLLQWINENRGSVCLFGSQLITGLTPRTSKQEQASLLDVLPQVWLTGEEEGEEGLTGLIQVFFCFFFSSKNPQKCFRARVQGAGWMCLFGMQLKWTSDPARPLEVSSTMCLGLRAQLWLCVCVSPYVIMRAGSRVRLCVWETTWRERLRVNVLHREMKKPTLKHERYVTLGSGTTNVNLFWVILVLSKTLSSISPVWVTFSKNFSELRTIHPSPVSLRRVRPSDSALHQQVSLLMQAHILAHLHPRTGRSIAGWVKAVICLAVMTRCNSVWLRVSGCFTQIGSVTL